MSKKVLMVLDQEFPPDERVYKEAKTLIQNGFLVTIACYTHSNKPSTEKFDGIQIIRKRIPKLIYKLSVAALKVPVYFNWWIRFLDKIIKNDEFDIIHIHDLPLAKVGVHFKQKYGLKLVVDLHENWPAYISVAAHTNTFIGKILSSPKQWVAYEKKILQHANIVVTVVDEMKSRIVNLGLDSKNVVVLQNTISQEYFNIPKKSVQNKHFTLFFAGGLNVERGLQYVIPAIKKLIGEIPEIKLSIVGSGSYLTHLQQLTKENNLENYVEFLGWKPFNTVLELTAQANISLIPHLKWEQTDCSSPNKLFQCMLQGVPLVVSNCNSVKRIVEETNSGLAYTFDNMDEFAEKVLELYRNPDLMQKMSENGRNAVLNEYNWQKTSKDFISMYILL